MVNIIYSNGYVSFADKKFNPFESFFGEKKFEDIIDGGEVGKLDVTLDYENCLFSFVCFVENDGNILLKIVF